MDVLATPATNLTATDTPSSSTVANGGVPHLSAEQHAQLAAAHLAYAPIRRALRVALFSALTLALFALLSLPFAFFSLKGLFAAAALCGAAVFEFRGRTAMGRLELKGPQILTRNQIVLTCAMVVYCLWSMADAWFGPDLYEEVAARSPEAAELLAPYSELFRQLAVAIYGITLVVGLIFQALVIRYYHTRRRAVENYLQQTPAWILAVKKT